ncbi:MAG: hypothetical protein IJH80_02550 [Ruminococcus sp.]|nr:hypothetical protein [Ruminococcus sp.]MBQ7070909.1 hypothetical protein [Ruminococcus sp.]
MTSKELLYIGDSLGHEKYFITKCEQLQNELQDPALKELAGSLAQKHRRIYSDLYGLL